MPFGRYKGRLLIDFPEPYVIWFVKKGFPEGELGWMLTSTRIDIAKSGEEFGNM